MTTIWKYPLYGPVTDVEMPVGAEIIFCADQAGIPSIWARVEDEGDPRTEVRTFVHVGTGHPVAEDLHYVGTAMTPQGFVWHVHERES